MKRGLKEHINEEQRVQDIINNEMSATDEEVLRVCTNIKKAYEKGLGEKLFNEKDLKRSIDSINDHIIYEWCRKGYTVGRLNNLENELKRNMEQYNIVID